MIREYNYHSWTQYMVRRPEEAPKVPHFAAVLFDSESTYSPPYDKYDSGSYSSIPITIYFAFPERDILAQWVAEAQQAKKKFFFFEVKKLGSLEVKVQLDVET